MRTSCEALFGQASGQPLESILELVRGSHLTRQVVAGAAKGAAALRAVAEASPPDLQAQLVLVADETERRIAELRRGGTIETDSTAFMAAGLHVVRTCEPDSAKPASTAQQSGTADAGAAKTTIPGDGTFLVGTDVVAGTYRTAGASPHRREECVVYASSNPADVTTYLRGSTSEGPAFLMLNAGEYVTTMFCQPFAIQG